ncbi:glycosyltransferase family 4 protein [Neiella sp. HB171785]|uniref:Glycosyltransferase family 4 protein n=1 Tax=Neiella litorisoli TaxID=2771431 RepID=A0A8J6QLP4_9GAMM|nr:glycosyltransferase family 4 protein [Neiella litorisoli]MBD1390537.1 glycosyltransferase family 4 protein [Neiella litorisoli]
MSTQRNVLQFICPTGFYGAERWILALAKHLPEHHIRSDLAVTLETDSKDLELVKQFKACCGEAFELPMKNRFDLSVVTQLVELIRERQIDIIHTHGYKSDIIGVLAARKAGIPCVVTPHGFENARDLKLRLFIWLGCKAMTYAEAVAPLSQALCEDSRRVGVKEQRLHYIQNGVDLSEIEAIRQSDRVAAKAPASKRIGFIGQMISRKNIRDILDIFNTMAGDDPNLELVLLGDGDERQALEQYSQQLPHHQRIKFLGFRDDRLELLKSFDLFVMSSTLEGIPRCLMEACAMETPIAAYDIPGIDQLIEHQQTGLLAPLGDKAALQQCWQQLLDNPAEAKQLGVNARLFVEEHFSAKRMAREYDELFRQLLGDS